MTRRKKGAVVGPVSGVLALLTSTPMLAAPTAQFCGVPEKLLLVVDSREVRNYNFEEIRKTTFVFTDRRVVDSEVVNTSDRHSQHMRSLPDSSRVARGTALPDSFNSLVSALGAARAGVAQDCFNTDSESRPPDIGPRKSL